MKNIHIIPTDKPSRLYQKDGNFKLNTSVAMDWYISSVGYKPHNIYITSDEEINEGDWFYDLDTKYVKIKQSWENSHLDFNGKKIILTTDQGLINEGVQPIDDEFLQWFVNNPGCEEVEVESKIIKDGVWTDLKGYVELPTIHSINYKIIIPKKEPRILTVEAFNKAKISYKEPKQDEIMERFIANAKQQETLEEKLAKIVSKEPSKFWAESDERTRIREERKQHLIVIMEGDEELGLYDEPKQDETEHLLSTQANKERLLEDVKQERMYSEEDMKSFGDWCRNGLLNSEYGIEKIQEHLEQWKQLKNNKPPL